jgi:serine/threonine-protein kinase
MEYLEGKNLNQVVRKEGPLAVERAVPVLIQVCGALQEAHLQGIIHRDLKPENIFLSTNGGLRDYPKVLDFGLAKVTERELRPGSIMLTQEGMVFGTPEFMSPEQAQGKPLDARSDIYSLAVILYEVVTGKLPFDARTPMEYIQMHVTRPPISIDERVPGRRFPDGFDAMLKKALEKRPEDRYSSAADFAQALKPFAGMGGKGFTAMMPKGTAESMLHSYEISQASPMAAEVNVAPAAAYEPPQASIPNPLPNAVSLSRPGVARTVKMSTPGALPATTPQGTVPTAALEAARKKQAQPSVLVLTGIAVGCLIAGILITMAALRFFG